MRLAIPAAMSPAEEAHWIEVMQQRFARSVATEHLDLTARAAQLGARFGLPTPDDISWSSRQNSRWGSCTIDTRRIRISDRMAGFPEWVIDSVIIHELAHLVESGHSPEFWELVNRNPLAERARGYLMAAADMGR